MLNQRIRTEKLEKERGLPSLSTLAWPIGSKKSEDNASSETSNDCPYNNSLSKWTTDIWGNKCQNNNGIISI